MQHTSKQKGSTESTTKSADIRVRRRGVVAFAGTAGVFLLALAAAWQSPAYAAEAPVGLGTAAPYSVLAGTTVTNAGPSTLGGSLGVSPGNAITGFPPGIVAGATHAGDAEALQAQLDLTTAYDDAAGRALTATVGGDLVGQTLLPGVYKSTGPLAVSGALTLNGQGNPNSVFIFQIASTLTTASASSVVLTNSAQACNVYWQVGSSATLGTASSFKGTIMALTSISVTTGATVEGRALARNGQVSLQTNVFTMPGCAATTPTTTATATATANPTATATVSATQSVPATSTASAAPITSAPLATTGATGTTAGTRSGAGGTTGMNQGTNVDTAGLLSPEGPWEAITVAAVIAVVAAAVVAGRVWLLAGRRRSS